MQETTLAQHIADKLKLPEAAVAAFMEGCRVKNYKKGAFLLRQGETCEHTFFVEKGILRQYAIDEKGREHLLLFATEGWFVSDRESSYFHQPSVYFIQAMEDSRVTLFDETFIDNLSQKIPEFVAFNNRALHNHIRQLYHRINLLLSVDAEKRYLQFIEKYPDVLLRVPQTMVASYLGITPESLSRVRKKLARKYQKKHS